MKKETPIIYNPTMILAIQNDWKTKTRRTAGLEVINRNPNDWQFEWMDYSLKKPWRFTQLSTVNEKTIEDKSFNQEAIKCPFGKVGDLLWVRENWRVKSWAPDDGEMVIGFNVGNNNSVTCYDLNEDIFNRLWEQSCMDLADAGYEINPEENYSDYDEKALRLRPSIHMPKEACRTWLEIVSIKVERLNDISESDATSEGIIGVTKDKNIFKYCVYDRGDHSSTPWTDMPYTAKEAFKNLWESINNDPEKPEAYWNANPWVWVIEFKKTDKPQYAELV